MTPQADPVPADTSRFTIEPFADVSGPFHLSADGSGNIYVGRQEMSAGASVSIHKVTPEGKVTEFGDPIPDPDAVAVGPGGNVFVGGSTTEGTSHITRISPDGSTSVLVELENLEVLNNPQDMEFQGGDCYMPTSGPVRTTGPER